MTDIDKIRRIMLAVTETSPLDKLWQSLVEQVADLARPVHASRGVQLHPDALQDPGSDLVAPRGVEQDGLVGEPPIAVARTAKTLDIDIVRMRIRKMQTRGNGSVLALNLTSFLLKASAIRSPS